MAVFFLGLLIFVGALLTIVTHRLDDLLWWLLTITVGVDTARTVLGAVVAAVFLYVVSKMPKLGVGSRPPRTAHAVAPPPVKEKKRAAEKAAIKHAAIHEGMGHAAVAHGIGAKGIKARIFSDGSGWCDNEENGLTAAQSIAITRAGEAAAGACDGCGPDRKSAKRKLDAVPRRERGRTSREADRLVARHINSSFGRRVAKALERSGKFH